MLKSKNTFYCFSPLAMLVTFIIEFCLAIFVVYKYRQNVVSRLVASLLVLLSVFQISEYHTCGRYNGYPLFWTRLGFMAITLLPALALHLIYEIARRKTKAMLWLSYTSSLSFVLIFGLSKNAFVNHVCNGNYAIFNLADPLGGYYFVYYYFWLFCGLGLSLYFSLSAPRKIQKALILQAFGYLSFILPTGIANTVNPQTIAAIPSVMCGFAVFYAFILVFGIMKLIEHSKS